MWRWIHVVVAIRHRKSTLEQDRRIAARVIKVLRHPHTENILSVKLGVVERIDVCAQRAAKCACKLLAIFDCCNSRERRLQRLQAELLDTRFVHVRRVVVADLARIASR